MDRDRDRMMTGAYATVAEQSPLEGIADRIQAAADQATEIGNKLNDHAYRVHGPIPAEGKISSKPEVDFAGALDRIYRALANLDHAHAYMAEAAGRNTTLA